MFQVNSLLELDIKTFPGKPMLKGGKMVNTGMAWKDLVHRSPEYFSNLLLKVRSPAEFSKQVHAKLTSVRRHLVAGNRADT